MAISGSATDGGGVSIYYGETFTHFTQKEGLSNNWVHVHPGGQPWNLWFGTYGGGVSMYNGETFTHFTEKEGLSIILSNPSWRTAMAISGLAPGWRG